MTWLAREIWQSLGVFAVLTAASCASSDEGVPLTDVVEIAAGEAHVCALQKNGDLACWGRNLYGETVGVETVASSVVKWATPVSTVGGLRSLSAGRLSTCGVKHSGEVLCWGNDFWGQVGLNKTTLGMIPTPTLVPGITGALTVRTMASSNSQDGACALLQTGEVICWGASSTDVHETEPTPLAAVNDVVDIAIRLGAGCALYPNGTVSCWGLGTSNGQANIAGRAQTSNIPAEVRELDAVTVIAGGSSQFCAARAPGDVQCWDNDVSNKVVEPARGALLPPFTIAGVRDVVSMAAFAWTFFGVTRDGAVLRWRAVSAPDQQDVERIPDIRDAVDVVAGDGFACVLAKDARVSCWGRNDSGQLGNGRLTRFGEPPGNAPVTVLMPPLPSGERTLRM
ncbi:MAG: hypothetical protein SF187_05635 [Deltaproteobacteria bacterium]|nr:hypothetical protein [Deltaproteobacteria bacterium]